MAGQANNHCSAWWNEAISKSSLTTTWNQTPRTTHKDTADVVRIEFWLPWQTSDMWLLKNKKLWALHISQDFLPRRNCKWGLGIPFVLQWGRVEKEQALGSSDLVFLPTRSFISWVTLNECLPGCQFSHLWSGDSNTFLTGLLRAFIQSLVTLNVILCSCSHMIRAPRTWESEWLATGTRRPEVEPPVWACWWQAGLEDRSCWGTDQCSGSFFAAWVAGHLWILSNTKPPT